MASVNVSNMIDKTVDDYVGIFLNDEYVKAAISLFLILYAGVIAPKLPSSILKWFDNWAIQIALFFAIVYISNKNATIALIASVAVLVTLMVANNQISLKMMINKAEGFDNMNDNVNGYNDGYDFSANQLSQDQIDQMNVAMADQNGIQGLVDDCVSQHDNTLAGMANAVQGGAITSVGGPVVQMNQNSAQEANVSSANAILGVSVNSDANGISGVNQSDINDSLSGSSVDDSGSLYYENASAQHNGLAATDDK
jgi:hypothetical protein